MIDPNIIHRIQKNAEIFNDLPPGGDLYDEHSIYDDIPEEKQKNIVKRILSNYNFDMVKAGAGTAALFEIMNSIVSQGLPEQPLINYAALGSVGLGVIMGTIGELQDRANKLKRKRILEERDAARKTDNRTIAGIRKSFGLEDRPL